MEFGNYKDSIQLLSQKKSANCRDCFCASPFIKYVLPSFLVVLLLLTFSYFGLLNWLPLEDPNSQATCHLQPTYHVPCAPGRPKTGKDECLELGCCWREDLRRCYHSYPSRYGYKVHAYQATSDGLEGNITASKKYSPTGKPLRDLLDFHVRQIDNNNFQISLKESVESRIIGRRFATFRQSVGQKKLADYGHLFDFLPRDDEVRITEFSLNDNSSTKVLLHEPNFSLTIMNSSTNEVILSTARGPLIMTDDYWELTLHLANGEALQGLGALELNGTTNWIYKNERRTIEPVFLALGANVGCRIRYRGPLEVQVLNGSNLVILRGISIPVEGLTFDLHTASDPLKTIRELSVTRAYEQLLSFDRLGLHLCPDRHDSLESAVESLKNFRNVGPWDSHCISRRHLGPTLEHEANLELVAEASRILVGRTVAAHLTPMLFNKPESPLQSSLQDESCLLGNATGTYVGTYDARGVVYPEWTEGKTGEIAMQFLDKYVSEMPLGFVVLRDAWPRDEMPHNVSDQSFDYLPEGLRRLMSNGTVPYDLQNRRHYTTHNAYAASFAEFVGARGVELRGHECNSPNIEATWSSLRSILEIGLVESMTGRLPTAMYVCGANSTRINEELCVRWYALAVVWPHILSVPEKAPFHETRLSRTSATRVSKLLQLRAELTTYQRTALAAFAKEGTPILADAAVYFSSVKSRSASQFLWGDGILVGLVLLPRHNQVSMWLPGDHSWRHLHGGSPVGPSANNSSIPVTVAMGEVALLVRPGWIIPVHEKTGNTSAETSLKSLHLLANPMCGDTSNVCQAAGRVYFGDNEEAGGKFLLITYHSNETLTLSHVLEAKNFACGVSPTQTSFFSTFQVLGTASSYPIALDLCELTSDVNVELVGKS